MTSQLGKPELMTTAEVVSVLGRSNSTVIRMVAEGKIHPAVKLPGIRGAYMFNRSEIEALAEESAK